MLITTNAAGTSKLLALFGNPGERSGDLSSERVNARRIRDVGGGERSGNPYMLPSCGTMSKRVRSKVSPPSPPQGEQYHDVTVSGVEAAIAGEVLAALQRGLTFVYPLAYPSRSAPP